MDKEIIVTIISGFFGAVVTPLMTQVVVPILKRRCQREGPEESPPKWPLPLIQVLVHAVLGGIMGVFLGHFLISPIILSPCPPFASTKVIITSPADGAIVPRLVTVQGTICHMPKDKELWLFVVPEGVTGYYPQAGPVVVSRGGHWSTSAYVGLDSPDDIGRGFMLIAVLADQQGSTAIRAYFAQTGPEFKGLEPLPQGVQLMTQVRVVRK